MSKFRSFFWYKTLKNVSVTVNLIKKMSQTQRQTLYRLSYFLREKLQKKKKKKKEIKTVNKKQPFLFNFCDVVTSSDFWK